MSAQDLFEEQMAAATSRRTRTYMSLFRNAEQVELAEKLAHSLITANFDVVTDDILPLYDEESLEEWRERKIKSVDIVLIMMCNDYQNSEDCKEEARTASILKKDSGKPRILFITTKANFVENDWMQSFRGKSVPIDLSPTRFDSNLKTLFLRLQGKVLCFGGTIQNISSRSNCSGGEGMRSSKDGFGESFHVGRPGMKHAAIHWRLSKIFQIITE